MARRTVRQHSTHENTFEFFNGTKRVAYVTLYDDGLIEFSGIHEVAIECVGSKNKEEVIVGGLAIKKAR
jgi:hypothetical protein